MAIALYPLRFKSIFKEKPWGGNCLKEIFNKDTPQGMKIGESWEIVDRGVDNSLIINGPYRGTTLHKLIEERSTELLGVSENGHVRFPLLVKFIDVTDRLSLQIHPDDAYAEANEKDKGKTEAWYVIRTEPGAWVIHGLKPGVSLEFFEKCIKKGDKEKIESCLNFLSVKSGDTIFIPPGTLHAAGYGLILLEVQQNSDLTYRIYDWGSNRPLHIDKAMEVIRLNPPRQTGVLLPIEKIQSRPNTPQNRDTLLFECDKFIMELLELEEVYERKISSFHILTFINGSGDVYYGKGNRLEAHVGDNILIPAVLRNYRIHPRSTCKLVVTSLPEQ